MKNSITKLCATGALALGLTATSCIGPNHAYNSLNSVPQCKAGHSAARGLDARPHFQSSMQLSAIQYSSI